jgi:hypothetical protein
MGVSQFGKAGLQLFACSAVAIALTGCGMNGGVGSSAATSSTASRIAIKGKAFGGQQPVNGALIQLYEVGQGGYTSAAKPLFSRTIKTDSTGAFSFSTSDYTCDSTGNYANGSYVYLTASGGDAGYGANSAIALMAALGSCSQLRANDATTFIIINEVTTVAGAYALAQFSGGTTFGTTLGSQPGVAGTTAPADNFATSATNVQGVANAMAVAQVLANTTTGTSPGTNSNNSATPEYWTVNTIADILAACVNSNGSTAAGQACGTLFTNTTPTGGTAPGDTIQAAVQMALHPGDAALLAGSPTGSTLDALIGTTPPFQPYVNTASTPNTINDWTIGISYTPVAPSTSTKLLANANSIAIDSYGNAWVTNIGGSQPLVELTPDGNPVQAGSTAGTYSVSSYNVGGTVKSVGTGGNTQSGKVYGVAIDTNNDAFASDYVNGYVYEVTASGQTINASGPVATHNGGGGTAAASFFAGQGNSTVGNPTGIAIDGSNNLYVALYGNPGTAGTACGTAGTKNIVMFPYTSGTGYGSIVYGSPGGSQQTMIAIDNGNTDNAGGAAIPGSPFVWWIGEASGTSEGSGHYGYLFQAFTGTTGASPQGCNTANGSISSANSSSTTKIATNNPSGTDAINVFNNAFAVAFDSSNNLWTANQVAVDASVSASYASSLTKLTVGYGASATLTPAATAAATTFATYTSGGLLASGFKPLFLAIDGAGTVWLPDVSTKTILAAVKNDGTGIAPASTGFTGAVYSPDGTTLFQRSAAQTSGVAIDGSGNIWLSNYLSTTVNNVVQVVGAAAPVVTPLSVAVQNHTLGVKP